MSQSLPQGCWAIESLIVNSETVQNYEGFEKLEAKEDQISILPAGLDFKVVEAKSNELVLDSQGQQFIGQLIRSGESVKLQLNRPRFSETIVINGRGCASQLHETIQRKREVVQV